MQTHQADVIIIGAGAIGISCAWFIAQKGLSVIVVDQNEVASGSSAGNAGLVGPRYFAPLAAPGVIAKGLKWMLNPESPFYIKPRFDINLIRWLLAFRKASKPASYQRGMDVLLALNRESITLYQQFAKTLKPDFGFHNKGVLLLYNSDSGEKDNLSMAETARGFGLQVDHFNRSQIDQMEPDLKIQADGGFFYQHDAHMTPLTFVQTMAKQLETDMSNVSFVLNTGPALLKRKGRQIEALRGKWRKICR